SSDGPTGGQPDAGRQGAALRGGRCALARRGRAVGTAARNGLCGGGGARTVAGAGHPPRGEALKRRLCVLVWVRRSVILIRSLYPGPASPSEHTMARWSLSSSGRVRNPQERNCGPCRI